jgi:hypothetical protein
MRAELELESICASNIFPDPRSFYPEIGPAITIR